MIREEPKRTPEGRNQENPVSQNEETFISPRFKSLAAMAGWDEESIIASLVVDDTPVRNSKQKRRSDQLHFKTPPFSSRRKGRAPTRRPTGVVVPVLNLEEGQEDCKKEGSETRKIEVTVIKENEKKKTEAREGQERGKTKTEVIVLTDSENDKTEGREGQEKRKSKPGTEVFAIQETKKGEDEVKSEDSRASCSNSAVPCLDKLREELSCAICLDICFEPSTTFCGHSFCKKCLRSAADKCGRKCPKCRELISNGRSCTVNTVLWNTIQLLFLEEIEARKEAGALNAREVEKQSSGSSRTNVQSQIRPPVTSTGENTSANGRRRRRTPEERAAFALQVDQFARLLTEERRLAEEQWRKQDEEMLRRQTAKRRRQSQELVRRETAAERRMPDQDEDAAVALRLQRDEFLEAFRGGTQERANNSLALARANMRAFVSRGSNIGIRNRPV